MDPRKIIVPVDFTAASDQAIKQAIVIAQKADASITLLHIIEKGSVAQSETELSDAEVKLFSLTRSTNNAGIRCDHKIVFGSIPGEIVAAANNDDNFMLVIGTHGIQGLKQKMFGADILKIVRKVSVPCLIVQENCDCEPSNPIVFPVGGHEGFRQLILATASMALLFGAEVHIYSIRRKGEPEYEKIRENTLLAEKIFKEKSISYKRITEDVTIISVGFARQTLQYANTIGAGFISIMSVKSEEHYYFAQADKETMINNQFNIPVLCTSDLMNH